MQVLFQLTAATVCLGDSFLHKLVQTRIGIEPRFKLEPVGTWRNTCCRIVNRARFGGVVALHVQREGHAVYSSVVAVAAAFLTLSPLLQLAPLNRQNGAEKMRNKMTMWSLESDRST